MAAVSGEGQGSRWERIASPPTLFTQLAHDSLSQKFSKPCLAVSWDVVMVDWSVFEKKNNMEKSGNNKESVVQLLLGIAKKPRSVFLSGLKSIQRQSVCDRGDGF